MTRAWSTGLSKGYISKLSDHHPAHGLPCPQNDVLINHSGQACLADFGLSLPTMASDQSTDVSSWVDGGATPWMSPELIYPETLGFDRSRPTKQSDCYALGMVIYEVLSGQRPFAPARGPIVILKVLDGERPERPQGVEGKLFTDAIWRLLKLCWEPQPSDRPSAETVLLCLEGGSPSSEPPSDTNGGGETALETQSDVTTRSSGAFSPLHPRLTTPLHDSPPNQVFGMFFPFHLVYQAPVCLPLL